MHIRSFALMLLSALISSVAIAQTKPYQVLKAGKKGDIAITQTTQFGSVTLAPGSYQVQHRASGSEHYIRFMKWEEVPNASEAYPQIVPGETGVVKCKVEPAPSQFKETTVFTEKKDGQIRITKIQIKGESVVHVIE